MYVFNPSGALVSGDVGISLALPEQQEGYDYAEVLPDFVFLVALDPVSLRVAPVGAGRVDRRALRVESAGKVSLKRLSHIGFAHAPADAVPLLEAYANGEDVSMEEIVGAARR